MVFFAFPLPDDKLSFDREKTNSHRVVLSSASRARFHFPTLPFPDASTSRIPTPSLPDASYFVHASSSASTVQRSRRSHFPTLLPDAPLSITSRQLPVCLFPTLPLPSRRWDRVDRAGCTPFVIRLVSSVTRPPRFPLPRLQSVTGNVSRDANHSFFFRAHDTEMCREKNSVYGYTFDILLMYI